MRRTDLAEVDCKYRSAIEYLVSGSVGNRLCVKYEEEHKDVGFNLLVTVPTEVLLVNEPQNHDLHRYLEKDNREEPNVEEDIREDDIREMIL